MRVKPKEAGFSKEHRNHSHDTPEEGGKNDDDFYCKGMKRGITKIQVKILEKGYENIKPAVMNFTIVEPFDIQPSADEYSNAIVRKGSEHIYILPTSDFQYSLSLVEMGEDLSLVYSKITLPTTRYQWSVSDSTKALGFIEQNGLLRGFNKPGSIEIQVIEKEFMKNTAET